MIELEGVCKVYGDRWAVRDLTLRVGPGTFFTYLGPNGAGKTTTMKMMAGLLRPTRGTVQVAGFDLEREPVEAKARLGYIPDHPFLYGKLTGRELLRLVADLHRLGREEAAREEERLLAAFDLGSQADTLIEGWSHGTRQRLAFAACFLHRPQVAIIDEPWVGLDPLHIQKTIAFLKERAREGTAIFMSTHSLEIAAAVAERIGILHQGKLIYEGTVQGLLQGSGRTLEETFLEMTRE